MSPIYINKLRELGCELWMSGKGEDAVCYAVFESIKDCWDKYDKVEEISRETDAEWIVAAASASVVNHWEGIHRATEEELLSY